MKCVRQPRLVPGRVAAITSTRPGSFRPDGTMLRTIAACRSAGRLEVGVSLPGVVSAASLRGLPPDCLARDSCPSRRCARNQPTSVTYAWSRSRHVALTWIVAFCASGPTIAVTANPVFPPVGLAVTISTSLPPVVMYEPENAK
jgi:hypothetical protein